MNVFDIVSVTEGDEGDQPRADIAICLQCEWRGPTKDCGVDEEGDWETGYYQIDVCPKCGEYIDQYDYTPERSKEWDEWHKRQ